MTNKKTRSRQTKLSLDNHTGRWCAKLGRKTTSGGNLDGHKFRFSMDKKESERRKGRIQELWDSIVEQDGQDALWDDESLAIAKAVEKGDRAAVFSVDDLAPIYMARLQVSTFRSQARLYAANVARLQERFPHVVVAPADEPLFAEGQQQLAAAADNLLNQGRHFAQLAGAELATDEATVAEALDAYEDHIRATMVTMPDAEEGLNGKRLTQTASSYLKQFKKVRVHNAAQLDWPLSRLTFDGCDAMLHVWRQRPPRMDGRGPLAIKTCREHAKRIKEFFRWLSRTDRFGWKKPLDFDELKLNIKPTNKEKAAPVTQQVQTYTVVELAIFNEYAVPFERFLLLAGLNLGFKRMEIATLRVGEIKVNALHPHAKFIAFDFFGQESFIQRHRIKTMVYGEWILWPLTVQAMQWALVRRKNQTHITKGQGKWREIPFSPQAIALLNDHGHAFTTPTKSGNPNHQLTNIWSRLLRRICKDIPDFPRLSQESLRDTAANWIREEFGGEIAEIFLAHGSPLGTRNLLEVYTNRPFGKLFTALQWLEVKLQPVFDATPDDPFPENRKLGGGGITRRQKKRICALSAKGLSAAQVAAKVGVSVMSVYRHRE